MCCASEAALGGVRLLIVSSDPHNFPPAPVDSGLGLGQQVAELTEVSRQLQATSTELLAAAQRLLAGLPMGLSPGDDDALAELTEATARSVHRGAAGCAELASQIEAQLAGVQQWR